MGKKCLREETLVEFGRYEEHRMKEKWQRQLTVM
jgi:hypothetical protein